MDYQEIIKDLESRGMMPNRPLSLEPMKRGLKQLGCRIDPARIIIVGGTNGKGSVCAFLEALLIEAGEEVGLYTSPHLMETTERIRIRGADISREMFCEAYTEVIRRTEDFWLSHFEILTLMAVWVFCSGRAGPVVNMIILEVGLGGTWDATNAIPHDVAVITSLGLDHENLLGSGIYKIAENKFGIVQPDCLVVHGPLPDEVKFLADDVRVRTKSRWVEAVPGVCEVDQRGLEPVFKVSTKWGEASLGLSGPRAARNAAIALTVFSELGYQPGISLQALSQIRWPGRMERLHIERAPCAVYLSGDHNPQGVESLLELLPYYKRERLHLLVGIGRDKDCDGILAPLFDIEAASVYLTETPFRGAKLECGYGKWLAKAGGAWANPVEALGHVLDVAGKDDLVVVTGSLYLVGAIRKHYYG